jgi:hypothetical protein
MRAYVYFYGHPCFNHYSFRWKENLQYPM